MQRDGWFSFIHCTDDHHIQPVPGVPQEGVFSHAQAPGHDLYDGFQRVDGCEGESAYADWQTRVLQLGELLLQTWRVKAVLNQLSNAPYRKQSDHTEAHSWN